LDEHGPLKTMALAELARLEAPGRAVRRLQHRNLRPLFCGQPAQLRRTGANGPDAVTVSLFGRNDRGPGTDASPHTSLTIEFDTAQEVGPSHA
ncbi:MAG TPA: hypothetical protein VHG70_11450, partial [Nocardioidaceae bacterium]|nr:hypothetical protein [Nocardioidaceae bacterium]